MLQALRHQPGIAVVSMTAPSSSPLDEPPSPALVVGSMPYSTKNKNTEILSSIPLHQWTVQQPHHAPLPFGPPPRPPCPRLTSQPARSLLSLVTRCPPDTAHGRGQLNSHCSPHRVRSLVGHHRCGFHPELSNHVQPLWLDQTRPVCLNKVAFNQCTTFIHVIVVKDDSHRRTQQRRLPQMFTFTHL